MSDQVENAGWFISNWKWLVAILTAGLISPVINLLRSWKRDNAEAQHITESSKMDTLQMSDALIRQWMQTASDATKRIGLLENCLWELLPIVEQVDIPGAKRAVAKVRHILNVGAYEEPKEES